MIYLDNAATTFPKPDCVVDAVSHFMKNCGGNPSRGGHTLSQLSGETVFLCREELSSLIGADSPEQIIFTKNTTEALNLAIKGVLSSGDEVIISSMEHNSVLRSCVDLEKEGVILKIVRADSRGIVNPENVSALITNKTKLICITHVSNVTGSVNPVREIYSVVREKGILMLLDAAQSGGVLDVDTSCADMIAFAGHKGLYGPMGTGALYVSKGIKLDTLIEGGTGSFSESAIMPDSFPDRFEAGTLNACGIAGLYEGIRFVKREGVAQKEKELGDFLISQMSAVKGAKIIGAPSVGVVGLLIHGHDCVDVATRLDREHHIATRAGLHCSPMAHRTLGTITSGLLRFSTGFFNTKEDISAAAYALENILKN